MLMMQIFQCLHQHHIFRNDPMLFDDFTNWKHMYKRTGPSTGSPQVTLEQTGISWSYKI